QVGPGPVSGAVPLQEDVEPALQAEGDTAGLDRLAAAADGEGVAEVVAVIVDRADGQAAADHLPLYRIDALHERLRVAGIEEGIGGDLPGHVERQRVEEAIERPARRLEKLAHLGARSEADDLAHRERPLPLQRLVLPLAAEAVRADGEDGALRQLALLLRDVERITR